MRPRRNTSAAHPICLREDWEQLDANFIVGQHCAVADDLFLPAHMHMIALYTVWYNYVKQHTSLTGPFTRDGGRYQRDALEHD
jgi:hypothetical protein